MAASERRTFPIDAGLVAGAFILFGVAIRTREYLFNRSLWLDEALLALKISNHSLDISIVRDQIAPPGFLGAVSVVARAFGSWNELTLRLVPLVASVAGLVMLYRVVAAHHGQRVAAFAALLLSMSGLFIYYATEFKQYAVDGLIGIALLHLFYRIDDERAPLGVVAAGLAGATAVVFSHPAALMLASIGIVRFGSALSDRRPAHVWRLAACGAIWLVALGVMSVFQIRSAIAVPILQTFHRPSFAPVTLSAESLHWYKSAVQTFFMFAVETRLWLLCMVLCSVGALTLWKTARPVVWLAVVNVVVLWTVSALHVYPIHQRFLMYLYPLFFLIIATGAERLTAGQQGGAVLLILAVMIHPLMSDRIRELIRPPGREETRELVQVITRDARPGDGVLVWQPTVPAYLYYRTVHSGWDDRSSFFTLKGDLDTPLMTADVERAIAATGESRVWVIASHMLEGGYGFENLSTLRRALGAATTIEHEWVQPDGFLWYCRRRSGTSLSGQ